MSIESVRSTVGQWTNSACDTVKSGVRGFGNFFGRAYYIVIDFWNDSALPFLGRFVCFAKSHFGKAKNLAENNPRFIRASLITFAVTFITIAAFVRFYHNGDNSKKTSER